MRCSWTGACAAVLSLSTMRRWARFFFMGERHRAKKSLRNRIQAAIEKEGIVVLAKRLGIASNTLYRVYKGDSVQAGTLALVEQTL